MPKRIVLCSVVSNLLHKQDVLSYREGRFLMISTRLPGRAGQLRIGLFAIVSALCIVLFTSISAFASTVNISYAAHVLNASQIQNDARNLSYPMNICTFI